MDLKTNIIEWFNRRNPIFFLISGLFLVVVLGIIDKITGAEISFSIFYLIPVIFVTRFSDRWVGIFISGASAIAWLAADLTAGRIYSHWVIPYWNAVMGFGFFLVNVYILSRLKDALEMEKMLSRIDSLTGIANGRYFMELVNSELIRSNTNNLAFTIAYMDLDNIKTINDQFGHNEGDIVLSTVAGIIQNNVRATDRVGRLGGDEFGILFPEMEAEESRKIMPKIHKSLLDTILENKWRITISMGVGTFRGPNFNVEEVLRLTESLMYSVKDGGKNGIKYEVFSK
jgi:diguanylate cyclase (GGDEF)-like protein